MMATERRRELCALLGLGLVRLRMRIDGLGGLAREMLAGAMERAA
ncbi:hypothetical protein [Paracoccus liaowanqingii]|nr:hypothetical protein [Paracoccus liaowanqingii]